MLNGLIEFKDGVMVIFMWVVKEMVVILFFVVNCFICIVVIWYDYVVDMLEWILCNLWMSGYYFEIFVECIILMKWLMLFSVEVIGNYVN